MSGAEGWGALSLIPSLAVLGLAVLTRRPLEALIFGSLVGHLMLSRGGFLRAFLENIQSVMAEPASVWVVLVVMLFGALIGILARAGGSALSARRCPGDSGPAAGCYSARSDSASLPSWTTT